MRQLATSSPERPSDGFVIQLYHKSKRNFWNPQDLDFSQDRLDWLQLTPEQQDTLLHLSALFVGGEEAVTLDLAPYLLRVAQSGMYDDALFVATWTFEEAKHAEFFDRFNREVCVAGDLSHYHGESYQRVFYEALPQAMNAVISDPNPAAQAKALCTYNIVVEGILAETGYRAYRNVLEHLNILPGLRAGLAHVQADEGRHIAYGLHALKRLMTQSVPAREAVEDTLATLVPEAVGVVQQIFAAHNPMPFPLEEADFIDYAFRQLQHRVEVLEG